MVAAFALTFDYFERGVNPQIQTFLDSLHWSVGLVTTIGYGNNFPVTQEGKILSLLLMTGGTIFLWTYMALFVSALVTADTLQLEDEIQEIEKDITKIQVSENLDNTVLSRIENELAEIKKRLD